jgi:hypothetical protein
MIEGDGSAPPNGGGSGGGIGPGPGGTPPPDGDPGNLSGDWFQLIAPTNNAYRIISAASGAAPPENTIIPATFNGLPVTEIGNNAFRDRTNLTSVTIPASITSISGGAFFDCIGLTSVTFASGSQLATIGQSAFANTGLTSITIPNSVTSIDIQAFNMCTSLTSVTFALGSQLTTIRSGAFSSAGLTSITIPDSVTSIGNSAFSYLTSLTSVTFALGSQLTTIGNDAFLSCTGLTSITIPNSVTSIGASAFADTGLTNITIPNSVTSIGDGAFSVCYNLISIDVGNDNPNYSSVNGVLYNKTQTILIQAPPAGINGPFAISNNVVSIGDGAFLFCTGLISITIPDSVTSIGDNAFFNCTSLESITINATTPPSLGSDAFGGNIPLTLRIIVPAGNVTVYRADPDWNVDGIRNRIHNDVCGQPNAANNGSCTGC